MEDAQGEKHSGALVFDSFSTYSHMVYCRRAYWKGLSWKCWERLDYFEYYACLLAPDRKVFSSDFVFSAKDEAHIGYYSFFPDLYFFFRSFTWEQWQQLPRPAEPRQPDLEGPPDVA